MKANWETLYLDARGFWSLKERATYVVTALIPEDKLSALPGMHYEVIEAIHERAKLAANPLEIVAQLYKRPVTD